MVDFSSMTVKASEAGSVTFSAFSADEFEQTGRLIAICLYEWQVRYAHEGEIDGDLVRVAHDLAVYAVDFENTVRNEFNRYND